MSSKKVALLLFAILPCLSQPRIIAQTPSPLPFDAETRSRDIVAHLNAVIQFYRKSTQPIQKAGEPNDVIYRDQAKALSAEVANFAFQSSKAEAALLDQYKAHATDSAKEAPSEQAKMQALEAHVEQQIDDLETSRTDVLKRMTSARAKQQAALADEKSQIDGSLELANAMKDALDKIVNMGGAASSTGLTGDIQRLQDSVPELQSKNRTASTQLVIIDNARSAGVTSQGMVLIELLETRRDLDALRRQNDLLHQQVTNLRTPVSGLLRTLLAQSQLLAPPATTPQGAPPQNFKAVTAQFKALSAAAVPLSQEVIALEEGRANIKAWHTSVDREYLEILHALLLRILVIAIALGLILAGGEVWTRVTHQYVRDIRRRRQFLLIRRTVVGFLSAIVLLFGFVTQFNSLATFAGFITAGIAVGLQTILLSVAAYFFIIGRYGVRVGDRITIASVTGDVIDVGLVRFYMMELAGSGTDLNPTGRVAVFSNAVLFQAGTPLYKQIPGTEYAWHELVVKLAEGANYQAVCKAVMHEVHTVFESYRPQIEQQYRGVESQMQTTIGQPAVESRLQSSGGVLQLWARFPVQIRDASETDEKVMRALADLLTRDPAVKSAITGAPTIQASVRG